MRCGRENGPLGFEEWRRCSGSGRFRLLDLRGNQTHRAVSLQSWDQPVDVRVTGRTLEDADVDGAMLAKPADVVVGDDGTTEKAECAGAALFTDSVDVAEGEGAEEECGHSEIIGGIRAELKRILQTTANK